MSQSSEYSEMAIRYLLGELSKEEQRRFEEQYLADDSAFDELITVETELIDRYVRGELSERERRQFEMHYLNSSERWRRVTFARALAELSVQSPAGTEQPKVARFAKWRKWWHRWRSIYSRLMCALVIN